MRCAHSRRPSVPALRESRKSRAGSSDRTSGPAAGFCTRPSRLRRRARPQPTPICHATISVIVRQTFDDRVELVTDLHVRNVSRRAHARISAAYAASIRSMSPSVYRGRSTVRFFAAFCDLSRSRVPEVGEAEHERRPALVFPTHTGGKPARRRHRRTCSSSESAEKSCWLRHNRSPAQIGLTNNQRSPHMYWPRARGRVALHLCPLGRRPLHRPPSTPS